MYLSDQEIAATKKKPVVVCALSPICPRSPRLGRLDAGRYHHSRTRGQEVRYGSRHTLPALLQMWRRAKRTRGCGG